MTSESCFTTSQTPCTVVKESSLFRAGETAMKLDVNVLRYLSKDEFRVLTAVEMGQKNVS